MRNRLLLLIMTIAMACPAAFAAGGAAERIQAPEDSVSAARKEYPIADYRNQRRYVVNGVRIEGVPMVNHEQFAQQYGVFVGDTINIPGAYITAAINKLAARSMYSYVDIVAEPVDTDKVDLVIFLEPTLRVSEWHFEGIRKGQATTLRDNMKLKPDQYLSDYDINKHKNYIKEYYKEKGYRNTEVDMRIVQDPTYSAFVRVTFVVDLDRKVKIGDITFSGNGNFSDARLRRTLKNTHKKNLNIFQGAKLKDKKYREDLLELVDFYNSKGYRNAFVVNDSIYDINDKRIGIHIDLSEGNKYYYRDIRFMGNTIEETDYFERMLGIEPGQPYDRKSLYKRLGIQDGKNAEDPTTIDSYYQNKGYLTVSIEPAENVIGQDSIDLEIKIVEGKPFTVNEVNISGNQMVDDEVIRREVYVMPGELYSQELLMMTLRRLASMGHFDQASIMPNIEPVSDQLVNISFPLTETPSDQFEISGGWGAGMFIGSVGIHLNNLSTRRLFSRDAWKPYPRGQNQTLSLRAQTNGSYYKAFSVSFMEPWMGGRKPVSLSLSAHYSDETDAYFMFAKSDKHFRTLGVSAGIGRRLSWPDPNFTLYNEISYTSYMLEDWDYFIMQNGNSNIFALTTSFGRNTLDWEVFPSRGSNFLLSVALTPPYSLFDNKDYSDQSMPDKERYKWIEYHKWKFKGDWYTALSRNNKLVLRAAVEMGYIGHYNKDKLSPFEGFDVGGSGMSGYNVYGVDIIGLRGYEDGAITPIPEKRGDYARVYNKYTAELRYIIIQQPTTQIYGLVFAEGGNAYRNWKEFNPFQIKRSLGVGARILLPMVGMIGFDWGFGFDAPAGQTKRHGGQVTFTFGNQF